MGDGRRDAVGDAGRRLRTTVAALALLIVVAAGVGFLVTRGGAKSPPARPTQQATLAPATPTPLPSGPVPGYGYNAVFDAATGDVVLVNGVDSTGATWLWDGRRWALAHSPENPAARFNAAAAYEADTSEVLLFGGRLLSGDVVNDTWAWDGSAWRELDRGGSSAPVQGEGSVMAWDAAGHTMLLVTPDNRTWAWTGTRWSSTGATGPGQDSSGLVMAFDPMSNALIAVGCCGVDGSSSSTSEWTGSAWRPLTPAAQPPFALGMALDPASGELTLCADASVQGGSAQTWRWSGIGWAELSARPTVDPDTLIGDTVHRQLLMLASLLPSTQNAPQPVHVWALNGSRWTRLDFAAE